VREDLRPYRDGAPIPSVEPFTPEHFEVAREETGRLLPALKDRTDPSTAINGMFSFTPDMGSIVGESADVGGFWICEAVWVTHAGAMGRVVAEWIVDGEPRRDMRAATWHRFAPHQHEAAYVREQARLQYLTVYDIKEAAPS
jgi:dimethylglycine oxidase